MRHWRKMTWALIAWSAVMAIWILGGSAGVGTVIVLWCLGLVVLGLIWFMTRPRQHGGPWGPVPPDHAMSGPATAPGWHPDPRGSGGFRWWNGRQWTSLTSQLGPPPSESVSQARD